jgi:hypothetical protein
VVQHDYLELPQRATGGGAERPKCVTHRIDIFVICEFRLDYLFVVSNGQLLRKINLTGLEVWARLIYPHDSESLQLLLDKLSELRPLLPTRLPDSLMIDDLIEIKGEADEVMSLMATI